MASGNTDLYGADPQGEALSVAADGLRNGCVLDINGGAADKSSDEQHSVSDASKNEVGGENMVSDNKGA